MIYGVVGSREGFSREEVYEHLGQYKNISKIVTGGAKGVDTYAEEYGIHALIPVQVFKPDFSKGYDVRKYFQRNRDIVEVCECLVAFWDGESRGTRNTIEYAKMRKRTVKIVAPKVV